jgi:hypothetical protein
MNQSNFVPQTKLNYRVIMNLVKSSFRKFYSRYNDLDVKHILTTGNCSTQNICGKQIISESAYTKQYAFHEALSIT